MFVPLEQARWPEPGEVRDLRISLNAPILIGGQSAQATRAALAWTPEGDATCIRLFLRPESTPEAVRGFELGERPQGPAARERSLEAAERFLGGLGFLFGDVECAPIARTPEAVPDALPQPTPSPVDQPAIEIDRAAIREDGPLSKFQRRHPGDRPIHASPRGFLARLVRPIGVRPGGNEA